MRVLRLAQANDAAILSNLAFRSKAHWGYSKEFMASCREGLTIYPQECASGLIKIMEEAGIPVGFYQLEGNPPNGKLSDLFIDPQYMGQGMGRALLQQAIIQARGLGFTRLTIASDPHAESFYLHMGAKRIGVVPSGSIPGRDLPMLELSL